MDLAATSAFFRLLSDPTRVRLVALLEREELTVAEMAAVTRLAQPRVSTHLARLKELDLGGLQRTDSGLWQVTVTDRGAETLSAMPQLEILSLRNGKITDVAVDSLTKLKHLKRLDVVNTNLTDTGLARLRAGLPNCEIRSGKVVQVRR